MTPLPYLAHYPQSLQQQVRELIDSNKLQQWLQQHYPQQHQVSNDGALRDYVMTLKQRYMKRSGPLSQVKYDGKIHIIHNALGTHTTARRIQGSKIKRSSEIRIGNLFKQAPEPMLRMIVVHELAHLKEANHGKAFYALCEHMLPQYHQLELATRMWLTARELR